MKKVKTCGLLLLTALLLFVTKTVFADKILNSEELKTLLTSNFMKVVYIYQGEKINMWEYYQKDGSIAGSTDKWGNYSASYEIKGDKICAIYSFEDYNGCYAYRHKSGNIYELVGLTWPENPTAEVKIVKGLYNNIKDE